MAPAFQGAAETVPGQSAMSTTRVQKIMFQPIVRPPGSRSLTDKPVESDLQTPTKRAGAPGWRAADLV